MTHDGGGFGMTLGRKCVQQLSEELTLDFIRSSGRASASDACRLAVAPAITLACSSLGCNKRSTFLCSLPGPSSRPLPRRSRVHRRCTEYPKSLTDEPSHSAMLLPSIPASLPAAFRPHERSSQLLPWSSAIGSPSAALLPAKRPDVATALAAPDTEAQLASTTTAQLDAGLRLHPDALARRQKAEMRWDFWHRCFRESVRRIVSDKPRPLGARK